MTTDDLTAALRACAAGLYPLEAGTELLIENGTFLRRDDFTTGFIEHGTSDGNPMAAINWDAAITALANGNLPCSGGERRILQLAASLAAGTPSASATPSPASMTATPHCWPSPSATQRENGRQQSRPMISFIQASIYGSNVKSSMATSDSEPISDSPRGRSAIGFGLPIPQESQSGMK